MVKTNALNCFKDMLDACAVAGGLNNELILHLTFNSNKYACGKLDHTKGMFGGYSGWIFPLLRCIDSYAFNLKCLKYLQWFQVTVVSSNFQLMLQYLLPVSLSSMTIHSGPKITCLIHDLFKYVQHSIQKVGQPKNVINVISWETQLTT